jgi:hypothetical protein
MTLKAIGEIAKAIILAGIEAAVKGIG